MKSDIFNENEDYKSVKLLTKKVHELCNDAFKSAVVLNRDVRSNRVRLVNNWPGDDLIGQVIRDAVYLLKINNVNIDDVA